MKIHVLQSLLFLIAIFHAMSSQFTKKCSDNCSRTFSASGPLTQHRNSCISYQQQIHQRTERLNLSQSKSIPTQVVSTSSTETLACRPIRPIHPVTNEEEHHPLDPFPEATVAHNSPSETLPPRTRYLPARYRDELPEPPPRLEPPQNSIQRVLLYVFDSFCTGFNKFGIGREYHHRPSHDPDSFLSTEELSNIPTNASPTTAESANASDQSPLWPWPNMTIWLAINLHSSEVTQLARQVLLAEDFKTEDLLGFDALMEIKRMGRVEEMANPEDPFSKDGWQSTPVTIQVPTREKDAGGLGNGKPFTIEGFRFWKITSVIRATFSETSSRWFHLTPFKHIWKSPVTGREQWLNDELYSLDAWNDAHDEIQKQQRTDDCKQERVVAALMFSLDATHLAQFGHAYKRASPNTGPCHPIAFIPSLPESLTHFISTFSKNKSHADLLAHCKRELIHAIWRILLDDKFVEAYKNGILIKCHDGVVCRVYPRIFTYSADYPEKIILATIHDKGICPCPRYTIPKSSFGHLGFATDFSARISHARKYLQSKIEAARHAIYQLGSPDISLVPTLNAFTERLSCCVFELFPALIVDLLHEFELGVLKSVLKHLIRILYSLDPGLIAILNKRFSLIPSFGINSIHHFPPNVTETRQRAAWHFEDMLQCTYPAFEGLFPSEHDTTIRTLLFRLTEWHALVKLRLHSDDSLALLDQALKRLSAQLRRFQCATCAAFKTRELPSEAAARHRQQEAMAATGCKVNATQSSGRCSKSFNMLTYKFHALGDYSKSIRLFGTTDSYTTQIGELAHRLVKKFYGHTNKTDPILGITKQECKAEPQPELHHIMAALQDNVFNLPKFLSDHHSDPAVKLKDHLLLRLYGYEYDGDECIFTDNEHNDLRFPDNLNRVIESKVFRVNYTTYDVRREQDLVWPSSGSAIMTLSREDDPPAHPFWYAKVLKALHISVLHVGPHARCSSPQTMEVLWVRWLGVEPDHHWGFQEARLPKVGYLSESDENAFGFLDPSLVVHGKSDEVDDWSSFYVNIFADRDMFCRFAGISIRHKIQYCQRATLDVDHKEDADEVELDTGAPEVDDPMLETEDCVQGDEPGEAVDSDIDEDDIGLDADADAEGDVDEEDEDCEDFADYLEDEGKDEDEDESDLSF
ncbi:hypothetical protein BDN67DRAFT_992701 [Paxillus ammoniavirescens]|nr:hypothetical protein BDN67DRAFT_992701 [Paxillus ammoniavirescens]